MNHPLEDCARGCFSRTARIPGAFRFRGASRKWPGNPAAIRFGITDTSLDPLVAFLFALECRGQGGEAIVLVAPRGKFLECHPGERDLYYHKLEVSVTLEVPAAEFAAAAHAELTLDDCRSSLALLGFDGFPAMIPGQHHLRKALIATSDGRERLNADQVEYFLNLAWGGEQGDANP